MSAVRPPYWGSSPRVRGTPVLIDGGVVDTGIIPACAGNTRPISAISRPCRDHPRVCGEHLEGHAAKTTGLGSSPRVRGTLRGLRRVGCHTGIIPACAGNTRVRASALRRVGDHPRVCGEHPDAAICVFAFRGSSPRVRGTPKLSYVIRWLHGIIPACAGNTLVFVLWLSRSRDHPRVCGEHVRYPNINSELWGSSPRVRGTHFDFHRRISVAGIIPACAGNTEQQP